MSSIINDQNSSRTFDALRKDCLTLIGDLRHVETELKRVFATANELGLKLNTEPTDSDITVLSRLATLSCEKSIDLRRAEEIKATKEQAENLSTRSRRSLLGRVLDKAASIAG